MRRNHAFVFILFIFTLLYIQKNAKNISLEKGFRIDPTSLRKPHRIYSYGHVSFIFLKQQKHSSNQSSQKIHFHNKLDFQSSDSHFYFIFLIKFQSI